MYIDAIKGSAGALIVLCLGAWMIPIYGPANEVEIILTVSTFLFAILAGFYIARLNTRYDQIRELVSAEDALWVSFYKSARLFGTE